jgi:hypothetical protein
MTGAHLKPPRMRFQGRVLGGHLGGAPVGLARLLLRRIQQTLSSHRWWLKDCCQVGRGHLHYARQRLLMLLRMRQRSEYCGTARREQ